jgi:hypothetical protein
VSEISSALKRAINQAISADGGLAVFQHYGFAPSRRPQKVNPFRQERTSSFFVIEKSGKIFFKDFGDDTYKGDCKKFIQFYENLDNESIWPILAQIYGLGNFGISDFSLKRNKIQSAPKELKKTSKRLLDIQFKDFSAEELDFWWRKGFIDLKTLEINQVKSLQSFKIQTEEGKIQEFVNLSFVFAYEIITNEVYKLYMPKPAYRVYAKAKTVFLPNLDLAREKFGENYTYSFGINTLDLQKPLILCGGEPDCLALKSAGFNAFTLGDERSNIPDYIQQKIYTSTNQSISVLYDTDYTGLKNSYLLAKKLDYQRFVLPKLAKQTTRTADKPIYNDLCDYLNLYGWDEDLLLILKQQVFNYQDFSIKNTPCFGVQKYLSEKSDLLVKFSRQHRRIQVDADAGVGKTYSMLVEIAAKFQKPMLFVVPFAIQVEQIEQEYRDLVKDLVCFSNSSMQMGEDEQLSLLGRPIGQINVCTFDRIKPVYERLKQDFKDDIVVVVDESHLLTSEYAYRARAIHDVLAVCRQADKVIYLSATPDYALCQFSNFRLIRFKREQNPQINIQPIDYVGEPKKALLKLLLGLTSKPSPKDSGILTTPLEKPQGASGITVIRLNNKTLARVIARILIDQKIYKSEEIDFVFSEKRRGISTKAKDSIVNHSLIPKEVKLLFVTACFDCGINIQNTDIQQIISFETRYTDNCLDTFKQFIARFRNLDKVSISVCKPERLQHLPPLKSRLQLYERLQKTAENKLTLLAYNDLGFQYRLNQQLTEMQNFGLAGPKTPRYIKTNQDISATFKLIVQNNERTAYQINYNYIRFIVKEYERKYLDSKNFYTNLISSLENTSVNERQTLVTDKKEVNNLILNDLVQREKENRQNRVQQICAVMQKNPQEFFDSVHAEYRDVSLKEQIKRQFSVSAVKDAPKLEQVLCPETPSESSKGEEIITPASLEGTLGAEGRLFDEEITELSHRYFFLHDLLIPKAKIPELLKNNPDDVNFGILSKTLINHINLYAKRKTGQECNLLITDYRKLEDVNWLELLTQEVQNWEANVYKQKKTRALELQLKNLAYDLKLLQYEKRNLNFIAFDYLLKIQQGEKLKAKLRLVKRKLKSLQNQINRLLLDIQTLKQKYENSMVKGFEINELSDKMNKLRTHQADWQGITANIRLLGSLFHLKTHKRLIYSLNADNEEKYTEKYILEIGAPRSFREVLLELGFTNIETQNYLDYLNYQIELDLEANRQIWSKKLDIPIKSTIVDSTTGRVSEKSSKIDQISPADLGYPSFWDN